MCSGMTNGGIVFSTYDYLKSGNFWHIRKGMSSKRKRMSINDSDVPIRNWGLPA